MFIHLRITVKFASSVGNKIYENKLTRKFYVILMLSSIIPLISGRVLTKASRRRACFSFPDFSNSNFIISCNFSKISFRG